MQGLEGIRVPTQKDSQICLKHHINYVFVKNQAPFCPKCVAEKIEQEKKQQIDDFKIESVRRVLKRDSLVDDRSEVDYAFNSFKAPVGTKEAQIKRQVRLLAYRYIKDKSDNFNTIFYGPPGEGKTHLAMSMLNAVNDHADPPQKCLFVNVNSLLLTIRKSFDNPEWQWTEEYAVNKLKSVDLLVVDDLGSESAMNVNKGEASNFVQRILYQVTNSQKRIITTTNLTLDQLRRIYNPKLVSRLLANSRSSTIDFSGITDKRL